MGHAGYISKSHKRKMRRTPQRKRKLANRIKRRKTYSSRNYPL